MCDTRKLKVMVASLIAAFCLVSCNSDDQLRPSDLPGELSNSDSDPGTDPEFDAEIGSYEGELADDADNDIVGDNEDFYWEANDFDEDVYVTYSGDEATVSTEVEGVLYYTNGAYVTVDMQTNSVKNVNIIVSGQSDDGQLKIYGDKKFKLTLNGLNLSCSSGPAINDQCSKRVFVHLTNGTVNSLSDSESYSDDPYYLDGATANDEDRKGCFFSEGHMIFSGTGVLVVEGKQKHGIATDGYFYMRPGVTIAVTDAAKNAIHVKGDSDDGIGIKINGGYVYANTSAVAGKAMKTDYNVEINSGKLNLNTSGGSEYDSDEQDTSSAACIKADGNVTINGGTIVLKSTGTGGKGINADGTLDINDGSLTVSTTGGRYVYDETNDLTSSPKGIKSDGNMTISGGSVSVYVSGVSDSSEGIESKATLTISGGEVYSYAYDDAINATDITITGGKIYAYSINNDGIDSNGSLKISGGLVLAVGTSDPEGGVDTDDSSGFIINGGTVVGVGGTMMVTPSSLSTQKSLVYSGINSISSGTSLCLLNSSSFPLMTFVMPRSYSSMTLFYTSPDFVSDNYTLASGGSISNATDNWYDWYYGGTWSNGTTIGSFTASSTVTSVGSGSGGNFGGNQGGNQGGGNMGGGPGGGR